MSITLVQANNANSGGTAVTSLSITLPTGVTLGDLLVVGMGYGASANTVTLPDSSWHAAVDNPGATSEQSAEIYYLLVDASHAGQTSWTFSVSSSAKLCLTISEWNSSTGWATSPVDQTATNTSTATVTTIDSGTTATTTQANELWVAALSYGQSAQTESGLTSGWTSGQEAAIASAHVLREVYQVATTTGAADASFTVGTAQHWGGAVATFKAASGGGTPVLATSPTSRSFSATAGGANPASQNDTLSETAGFATAWTSAITYGSGSGWLSISPTSGSLGALGSTTISVSPTTGSLTAGTYTATVTFTATTGGATATISVSFTVTSAASPGLSTTPSTLNYTATVGSSNPASQTSTLLETHGVGTAWTSSITYTSGSGWLGISPSSGTLTASGNVVITVQPTTGSLAVGSYSATVTFTATTGGATATITINFTVQAIIPANQFRVTLAGQDITLNVDQLTLVIDDTLGQGAGAGGSGATQGRASTIKFDTNLGPMNTALGAGQTIPTVGGPYLVRQGEVIVYDSTNTIVWAGYATKYTDVLTSKLGNNKRAFTAVEGIDYSTSLQRTLVNEVFSAQTDIFILRFILQKYAPWINLQYLPVNPAYTFPIKNFRNQTVEQVIQTVAGITGYLAYVDYQKNFRYVSPTVASSAPYNISTNPDFIATFPAKVDEFLVDDNSAINRVFFYGGTKLSNDFFQDVSGMANGSNLVFVMAFYPSPLSTGGYRVTVNGVPYVTGTANGQAAGDQFISAGGTAQVLVDPGSRTATFDTGLAPALDSLVLLGYRYSFPLSLVITDEVSHKFFGPVYLDGSIDDNTIFDITTAIQRCKVLLSQQNFGLTTLKLTLWNHPGVQAGMVIHVFNSVRGINGSYLVQEVQIEPIGGGNFYYHLSLGAWNWGLIDFLLKLPTLATFQDDQTETQETVTIESLITNVQVRDTWTKATRTGPYYARSAPVGDGHDAYPGLSTISS